MSGLGVLVSRFVFFLREAALRHSTAVLCACGSCSTPTMDLRVLMFMPLPRPVDSRVSGTVLSSRRLEAEGFAWFVRHFWFAALCSALPLLSFYRLYVCRWSRAPQVDAIHPNRPDGSFVDLELKPGIRSWFPPTMIYVTLFSRSTPRCLTGLVSVNSRPLICHWRAGDEIETSYKNQHVSSIPKTGRKIFSGL